MNSVEQFIRHLPKAELHMHLEGCIEPEMMLQLAERNGIALRWDTPDALRAAYQFKDLQDFLSLYFEGCKVIVGRRDFYDVTRAYLDRSAADGLLHAEMFIGPQSFMDRKIPVSELMGGVLGAMDDAREAHGITSSLLISTHRHRSEVDAFALLEEIMPWADRIIGIGMGGAEVGHPPSKFERYFAECRERGFYTCIHAGEEGPAAYVREALQVLKVDRIDHGNSCMDDPALVAEIARRKVPLTVCPLSNLRLKLVPSLEQHPLRRMLDAGLVATVNSDDPPYFGGYVNDNFVESQRALELTRDELVLLARNSFKAAFLSDDIKARYLAAVDAYDAEQPAYA